MNVTPTGEPQTKKKGGARPGAGRKRESITPFSVWAATKGLSGRDLAAALGVSSSMVNQVLAGKARPGLDLALKIERLTGGIIPVTHWSSISD